VLIVDDDQDVAESLTDILSDEGYRPATAPNGLAALEYLRSGARPCVILLDWMMPVCDGPTFRGLQRQDPALADIPVVVLSADARVKDRVAALEPVAYLPKPVALETLLEILARTCAGR
jgi:CheY-like chemotaxis protein